MVVKLTVQDNNVLFTVFKVPDRTDHKVNSNKYISLDEAKSELEYKFIYGDNIHISDSLMINKSSLPIIYLYDAFKHSFQTMQFEYDMKYTNGEIEKVYISYINHTTDKGSSHRFEVFIGDNYEYRSSTKEDYLYESIKTIFENDAVDDNIDKLGIRFLFDTNDPFMNITLNDNNKVYNLDELFDKQSFDKYSKVVTILLKVFDEIDKSNIKISKDLTPLDYNIYPWKDRLIDYIKY